MHGSDELQHMRAMGAGTAPKLEEPELVDIGAVVAVLVAITVDLITAAPVIAVPVAASANI